MTDIDLAHDEMYRRNPKVIKYLKNLGINPHIPTQIKGKVFKRKPLPGQMYFGDEFVNEDARNE